MRQRHTVTEAHTQRSVMDHRHRALLCLVVAFCEKKREKSRKVYCQPCLERRPTLGSYAQIFVVLASDESNILQF